MRYEHRAETLRVVTDLELSRELGEFDSDGWEIMSVQWKGNEKYRGFPEKDVYFVLMRIPANIRNTNA